MSPHYDKVMEKVHRSVQFTTWLLLISFHVSILHLLVYLLFILQWNQQSYLFFILSQFVIVIYSGTTFSLLCLFCCRTARTQHMTSIKGLTSTQLYHLCRLPQNTHAPRNSLPQHRSLGSRNLCLLLMVLSMLALTLVFFPLHVAPAM